MTLNDIQNIKLLTTDTELRRVVEQLNNRIELLRANNETIIAEGSNHIIHQWEYADSTARTGATGFVASDIGKVAKQLNTLDLYVLTATNPTWRHIGTGGTPASHNTTHQSGGTDSIKLDDLATPDDNTDLNASSTRHGLLPKLDNTGTKYLRDDGTWQPIAGGGGNDYIRLTLDGNAYVGTKITGVLSGIAGTIISARAYADTAPTGASIQIDINKNGTSIFSTVLEIDAGSNADDGNVAIKTDGTKNILATDRLTMDIDRVGSTVAGGNFIYVVLEVQP